MLKLTSGLMKSLARTNVGKQEPFTQAIVQELMRQHSEEAAGTANGWDFTARTNILLIRELRKDLMAYYRRKKKAEAFADSGFTKLPRFGPSGATDCMRRLWLRHYEAPQDPISIHDEVKGHLMKELGTMMHLLLQVLLMQAGVLKKREVRVKPDGTCVSGFMDGLAHFDFGPRLLEIKTIGDNKLRSLGGKPADYHVAQGRLYQAHYPYDLSLLYVARESCTLQENLVPYDKAEVERAKIRPSRHKRFVLSKQLPCREGSDLRKPPCRWCEFTAICFSGMELTEFVRKVQNGKTKAETEKDK